MPLADLASSFNSFFHAAASFFGHLSDVRWTPFAIALACLAGMQLSRAWAWRNVLRAAYPGTPISFLQLSAAYLAGAGINAIVPARAGDVTKVFLVKRQIPHSSYPAVTSSFLVQSVFDITAGILVFLYAMSQGLLPDPPRLPHLPAFEISFWANHPRTLLIVLGVLLLATAIGVYYLAHHVRRFWDRVKQGLAILAQPRRYLREVWAWQGIGWLCRFGAFWFFLEAFGIGGSVGSVMLVMSVQAISTIVPLHPGRRRRPAGAARGDAPRPVAGRRSLLLGGDPDRDGGVVGGARLRRDPARLPHDGLARAHTSGRS
ncbi:MAG: YbhN family protein [Solirubrobacterales bacterium]